MSNLLSDRLTALAECLCAEIGKAGPRTCFCGVVPGSGAVAEYSGNCNDKCGMAWVRLVTIYPSDGVGQQAEAVGNCYLGTDAIVEVGILRCAAMPDDRGNPPTGYALLQSFEQQTTDALTMQRAIMCCEAISPKDIILGVYTPQGPLGGMVGGVWQFTMGLL